ncbi:MAG TPA: prepilin-type N-terminal cleavage/methylation domain-containing protein [Fimbriimonadaceae bacterium]|nr:prepilin-type N-terminal cleavage/methylation domain-containing protein [Fimbriimonadaceae bacterium]
MSKTVKDRGFTLVEIMIVVLIIGILMAIAVPNFVRARESSRRSICIGNLKQIDSAKEQWAMDNKASSGTVVQWSDIVGIYMRSATAGPVCPAGGSYTINPIGTDPTCSLGGSDQHVLPY